jgi:hypothetical protein
MSFFTGSNRNNMLIRTLKATNLIKNEPENISQNDYEKPSKKGWS